VIGILKPTLVTQFGWQDERISAEFADGEPGCAAGIFGCDADSPKTV